MMVEIQQPGPLTVLASLLGPPATARPTASTASDPNAADLNWDDMVRWFSEQREWAELVATYTDVTHAVSR